MVSIPLEPDLFPKSSISIYGAEMLVHGIPPPRRGKGHYVTSTYKTDTLPPTPPCGTVVLPECRALPPTPPVVLWCFQSVEASKPTAEHVPNTEQIHYPPPPPVVLWYLQSVRGK